ncbi:hypothetical protein [Agaricicola taiwanensis]|uniref:hypothetical protein n=1 Tax=Agaricicola taiwanensis TaxID=591372 RepID=UPI0016668E85|nr:hypothetical protein [Agaricicola taiwanensis]
MLLVPASWIGSAFLYEQWHRYEYRFKLTVEVDVDGEFQSSSQVYSVSGTKLASWLPQRPGMSAYFKGEGIFIDLGSGRNIVTTLMPGPTPNSADLAYLPVRAFRQSDENWVYDPMAAQGRKALPKSLYPVLVTFSDPHRSSSVSILNEESWAQYAENNIILKIYIEMTEDRIAFDLEEYLPWLKDRPGRIGRISDGGTLLSSEIIMGSSFISR